MTVERIRGEPGGPARIVGEKGGPGSFVIPSISQPGRVHFVEWQNAATRWCDCNRFAQKQSCRHVEAVEALWRQETEEALAARRSDPEAKAEARAFIERMEEIFR